ncbi:MAG: Abi family protein [Candidatus Omnitrophota bacterium]|jgi:abortive infection bacteriophage resistance protein
MKQYNKPPLTFKEQVNLLINRGLIVNDLEEAERFLSHANYYRFSAYCLPFEKKRHEFLPDIHFSYIQKLYEFDRELRFLVDEALEVVEIALRTWVTYYLVHKYGAFMHEDQNNFYAIRGFEYSEWIKKVHDETKRSQETFIRHYKENYVEFPALPLWMAVEVMSFGSLSKLVSNLYRKDQESISRKFNLHSKVLLSWLHTFTYVRNICAHHGRLWNRNLSIAMVVPRKHEWEGVSNRNIVCVLFALKYFMSVLYVRKEEIDNWGERVETLLEKEIPKLDNDKFYSCLRKIRENILWKKQY